MSFYVHEQLHHPKGMHHLAPVALQLNEFNAVNVCLQMKDVCYRAKYSLL